MVFSHVQNVPLSAIEQYLQGVKTTAPFLQEEEAQLLQYIELGKVELVQEGNMGLLQALEKFDGRAGSGSFCTWAFSWVRGMMLLALWQYDGAIRLPQEKACAVRRLRMVHAQLCTVVHKA